MEGGLSADRITVLPLGKRPIFYVERMLGEWKTGDCVLFKGAHASPAEEVFRTASELLVRKEKDLH